MKRTVKDILSCPGKELKWQKINEKEAMVLARKIKRKYSSVHELLRLNHDYSFISFYPCEAKNEIIIHLGYPALSFQENERTLLEKWFSKITKIEELKEKHF